MLAHTLSSLGMLIFFFWVELAVGAAKAHFNSLHQVHLQFNRIIDQQLYSRQVENGNRVEFAWKEKRIKETWLYVSDSCSFPVFNLLVMKWLVSNCCRVSSFSSSSSFWAGPVTHFSGIISGKLYWCSLNYMTKSSLWGQQRGGGDPPLLWCHNDIAAGVRGLANCSKISLNWLPPLSIFGELLMYAGQKACEF